MRPFFLCLFACVFATAAAAQVDDRLPAGSLIEDLKNPPMAVGQGEKVRSLVRAALEVIKHFEGWGEDPYNDPAGYCTVGYGHLLVLDNCNTIDRSKIESGRFAKKIDFGFGEKVLDEDTWTARRAINQLVTVDLTAEQFGALTSFVFNVGKKKFEKSTLLRLLNRGEYDLSATQLRRWIYAGGQEFDGLKIRRDCEESLFRGQLKLKANEEFKRTKCQSFGAAPDGQAPIDIFKGEE